MWAIARAGDYRLGVVINHNRPPDSEIVEGVGYAIFFCGEVHQRRCDILRSDAVAGRCRTEQVTTLLGAKSTLKTR
ncbi:hypothetical protein EJ997_05165 [Flaviflexus ciconiae]|uniref:Uncharacterized protein n=1 Tax=Flaviflexus ciconiae TaxID=2496867 RepID=A0A3S9PWS0_9ACTO|nr:hypothetical protein [Flaviflexus ciconiae]AZQ76823.1 hypothetical protein EJ997_05165 [Flaviflexus ciconiae]